MTDSDDEMNDTKNDDVVDEDARDGDSSSQDHISAQENDGNDGGGVDSRHKSQETAVDVSPTEEASDTAAELRLQQTTIVQAKSQKILELTTGRASVSLQESELRRVPDASSPHQLEDLSTSTMLEKDRNGRAKEGLDAAKIATVDADENHSAEITPGVQSGKNDAVFPATSGAEASATGDESNAVENVTPSRTKAAKASPSLAADTSAPGAVHVRGMDAESLERVGVTFSHSITDPPTAEVTAVHPTTTEFGRAVTATAISEEELERQVRERILREAVEARVQVSTERLNSVEIEKVTVDETRDKSVHDNNYDRREGSWFYRWRWWILAAAALVICAAVAGSVAGVMLSRKGKGPPRGRPPPLTSTPTLKPSDMPTHSPTSEVVR